jgi:putative DNA primase/helicase
MQDGDDNDGLIQRFQLLIWPEKPSRWSYEDRPKDTAAFEMAEAVYRRLATLDPERPVRLKFNREAQSHFADWLTNLMDVRLRNEELHSSLESHFAKYRSLMPSLALLFSLADGNMESVGLEHCKQAESWCEYLMGHAKRVYASKMDPAYSAALALKGKLERGQIGGDTGKFTVREVYRNEWRGLTRPEQVRAALRVLEDYSWVRPDDTDNEFAEEIGIKVRGRHTETYILNPKVLRRSNAFAERGSLETNNALA